MKERFIQFLKDNDALEKFSANLFDEFGETIGEHIASVGPFDFIVSAFTWYDTEEGNDYWLGIDKLWHEQLNIEPMDKEYIMENQLEILKALLEGKTVYDGDGNTATLKGDITVPINTRLCWLTYLFSELDQFTLTPQHKPLTFERIRKECVSGKHLLVDKHGNKLLFIGFNRGGKPVTDDSDGEDCIALDEHSIKDWTIEEYKGEK